MALTGPASSGICFPSAQHPYRRPAHGTPRDPLARVPPLRQPVSEPPIPAADRKEGNSMNAHLSHRTPVALSALLLGLATGCGTTRMTDSTRTATEQLLISSAVD